MPLGSANALTRPLGQNMPLPGGEQPDMPQPRATAPGGAPGGLGTPTTPAGPRMSGGVGDLPSPDRSFDGTRKTLMQQHTRSVAQFDQTTKALKKLDAIRKGLERLQDKQDLVTMDDVVDEAGKLVAHGIDPMALAGMLADAPQQGGGEALGGWVASHAQTAAMGEQRLMIQNNIARHQMAVSAIHLLTAHANAQAMMGDLAPGIGQLPQQNGNDLALAGDGKGIPAPTPGDNMDATQNRLSIGSRFMEQQ